MTWRHDLYPDYKKKKRRIDPRDVAPEVGHQQEVDKQQAVQDADMNEEKYLQDPETQDISQPLQSTEMDKIYEKDKIDNLNKDRAIEASDKAHKAGNISDEEHIQNLLNAPNYITAEQMNDASMKSTDLFGDVLTLAAAYAASKYTVKNPTQVASFGLDLLFPDVEGVKFEQWTRLNPQVHLASKGTQIAAIKSKQYLQKLANSVVDYTEKIKEYISHQRGGLKVATVEGVEIDNLYSTFLESRKINDGDLRPDFTSPVNPNARIGNLGGRGFKEKSELIRDGSQTTRMEKAFDENKKLIGKEHIDNTIGAKKQLSEIDKFAKVTKTKLRKYVEQFGVSAVDLEEIFKEYSTKHNSALNAKAWLNEYWKDLNKGIGQGGLKNARLKIVNDELKIVDGRTKKTIAHPFELDHSKAKELMHKLGLEGADMSDNLDIVYTEWNRAKNNIGNPAIPDEISEAIGQSTSLENFVRRRLDETFKLEGERVPQRFKEAAKVQMLDDAQNLKPNEKLKDVIEKRLKLYDRISNFMVQIDDYVPKNVQRQFDKVRDLNPQEYLQDLKDRGIYDRLTGPLKKLHDKLSDDWINMKRGLRSRPTTKYMKPGHDV